MNFPVSPLLLISRLILRSLWLQKILGLFFIIFINTWYSCFKFFTNYLWTKMSSTLENVPLEKNEKNWEKSVFLRKICFLLLLGKILCVSINPFGLYVIQEELTLNLFQKFEEEGTFSSSFCETCYYPDAKARLRSYKKRKPQTNLPDEHKCKNLQQDTRKLSLTSLLIDHT